MSLPKALIGLTVFIFVALGFFVGLNFFPVFKQDRLEHINTHVFIGGYLRPEQLRAGWKRPNFGSWGTESSGSRAELALPIEITVDKDIKLKIDFSLSPSFTQRRIEIAANGEKVGEWEIKQMRARHTRSFRIPYSMWKRDNPINISLVARHLEKSQMFGTDKKQPDLGIILHAISVYQMS